MRPLFPPWADSVFRLGVLTLLAGLLAVLAVPLVLVRTPYANGQHQPVDQPVQFDHRHHAGDDGIPCLYCHGNAERSPWAGVPPTSLCMGCHNQVWPESPLLEPVRRSFFQDQPIRWNRVNALPRFVFFNHAAHVNKGVGCVTCHGRVDRMAAVEQQEPLTMQWCLECHRSPAGKLRPVEHAADMDWQPPPGNAWKPPAVNPPTHCSACHR